MSKEIEKKYLIPEEYQIPQDAKNKQIRQSHLIDDENIQSLITRFEWKVEKTLSQHSLPEDEIREYVWFLKWVSLSIQEHFSWEEFSDYKIRVRITDKNIAELTCKWKNKETDWVKVSEEFNIPIPLKYAYFLLTQVGLMWEDPLKKMWKEIRWITKRRYKIMWPDEKKWDFDQYLGANRGIRTADIELKSVDEWLMPLAENSALLVWKKAKPYKNKRLQKYPFKQWAQVEKDSHKQIPS